MILGCKRIHKPKRTLSGFLRIFMKLCRSKVQLAPPHGNFINGVANPEIVYTLLLFQILCIDWYYYFEGKLIKYLMDLHGSKAAIWIFFEKWMLWVVSLSGVDAFLPIWILFAPDFYCYILSSGYRNRSFRGKYQNFNLSNKTDLRWTNMAPQFLWSCLTNRTISPETYSEPG